MSRDHDRAYRDILSEIDEALEIMGDTEVTDDIVRQLTDDYFAGKADGCSDYRNEDMRKIVKLLQSEGWEESEIKYAFGELEFTDNEHLDKYMYLSSLKDLSMSQEMWLEVLARERMRKDMYMYLYDKRISKKSETLSRAEERAAIIEKMRTKGYTDEQIGDIFG